MEGEGSPKAEGSEQPITLVPGTVDYPLPKKLYKRLRRRQKFLENKVEIRRAQKQKRKERLAERRARGEEIGPNRKHLKLNTMELSKCKLRVVLDLSFDDYMSDKDINSLVRQIEYCYSANRRARNPLQLYTCNLGGRTKKRLDEINDYKGWDIHYEPGTYIDTFDKDSIIYLTSESSNVLTSLWDDKVYVIGGLVDHNSQKGLCHRLAQKEGVTTAQLPISEYLRLQSSKVLTVNHVFSILLRYTETRSWEQALLTEIPTRKGVKSILNDDEAEDDSLESEQEKIAAKLGNAMQSASIQGAAKKGSAIQGAEIQDTAVPGMPMKDEAIQDTERQGTAIRNTTVEGAVSSSSLYVQ